MESVRDPTVGPQTAARYGKHPHNTRSNAGPIINPSFPQLGGIKEILPVVGKPIEPIGI